MLSVASGDVRDVADIEAGLRALYRA